MADRIWPTASPIVSFLTVTPKTVTEEAELLGSSAAFCPETADDGLRPRATAKNSSAMLKLLSCLDDN